HHGAARRRIAADPQSGLHGRAGARAVRCGRPRRRSEGLVGQGGVTISEPAHRRPAAQDRRLHMLANDQDILRAAEDWRKQGRGVALATVVETWGSAPRPVGSNLVIDDQGNFLGSVSGGCVEGAVVTEALDVIESGKPKTLEFGVADETAWKVGLS